MKDQREKLIKELLKLDLWTTDRPYKVVADFILADRKRIVEPLVKIKNTYRGTLIDKAIDKTLTRAGVDP